MPHAALWVVQHGAALAYCTYASGFNAARGFVGGAAVVTNALVKKDEGFNAARGFVGGAAWILFGGC